MTAERLQKNQIKGTGRPVPFHTLRSAAVRLTIYFLTLMTTSLSVFSKNLPRFNKGVRNQFGNLGRSLQAFFA